jgi:ornithine cyclodeaminase/alanine dehydrogenase-like protein (mu-crystallin family)
VGLVLGDSEVARALDLVGSVHAVEDACLELAAGRAVEGQTASLALSAGGFRFRSAALVAAGAAGYEEWRAFGSSPALRWRLFEIQTGRPLALLEGARLDALAAAAAGAVAVRHLAPPAAGRLGVLGLDERTSLEAQAIAAVLPLKEVTVSGARLADELGRALGLRVRAASPGEVVARSQLLVVGSDERLDRASLPAGLHVNLAAADGWPGRLVDAPELARIVAQEAPGRSERQETTAYLGQPSAVFALALAVRAVRMARELRLGREAELS